jgi:hypothetical protein
MAKNYASIYASSNDSSALEQRYYLKEETARGLFTAPASTDYLWSLSGGSTNFTQPINPSPHRSGRHNNNTIKEKKVVEWSFPTFININTDVGAGATEIDAAVRLLFKSLLGRETISSGLIYDSVTTPNTTFTLLEVGDMWCKQTVGCWVDSCEIDLPGDGQSKLSWSGHGKTSLTVGIGKSTTANAANAITLQTGEARRFPVGSEVMIVKANGTSRSTDTTAPRKVTASDTATDIITVDGAALLDADGTTNPVYVVYWEPTAATGIDNPQTGLVGSFSVDTLSGLSLLRSAKVSINNNHELVNYGFGTDSLAGPLFVPGGRLSVTCEIQVNMNSELVEFLNRIQNFDAHNIQLIVGDTASRYFQVDLPKVIFPVPSVSVPENGSIPVTCSGMAYQTALDAADEITVSYK